MAFHIRSAAPPPGVMGWSAWSGRSSSSRGGLLKADTDGVDLELAAAVAAGTVAHQFLLIAAVPHITV